MHRNRIVCYAFVVACLCALTAVTVVPVQAGGPADHVVNASEDGNNGLNYSTIIKLWGGDVDGNISYWPLDIPSADDYGGNETRAAIAYLDNLSASQELAIMTDFSLSRPVNASAIWTRNDFEEWQPGDGDTSRYPAHANTASEGIIKDAHVTLFAQQPTTYAHVNNSTTARYTGSSGRVYGAVDYRVIDPEDSIGSERRVFRDVVSHQITDTCLLESDTISSSSQENPCTSLPGAVLTGGSGNHHINVSYSTKAVGQEKTHGLGAAIQATYRVTVEVKKTRIECSGSGDSRTCYEVEYWEQVREYLERDDIGVTDTWNVTVYDLDYMATSAVEYSDGDVGLYVQTELPTNGYSYPTGRVNSHWDFYTMRNPRWDDIISSSKSGTSTEHSEAHPIRTHAFPNGMGYYSQSKTVESSPPDIVEKFGKTKRTGPVQTVPRNLSAGVPQNYTSYSGVISRANVSSSGTVRARPLVRGMGTGVTVGESSEVQPVREANLSATVVNQSRLEALVKLKLTNNETGEPISTADREGYIEVDGKKVQTNQSGIAYTTIPRWKTGYATFVPGEWWTTGRKTPYEGDSTRVPVRSSFLSVPGFYGTLTELALLLFPILYVLYALDGFLEIDTWPPWKEFK